MTQESIVDEDNVDHALVIITLNEVLLFIIELLGCRAEQLWGCFAQLQFVTILVLIVIVFETVAVSGKA